jgi:hypothetical protein
MIVNPKTREDIEEMDRFRKSFHGSLSVQQCDGLFAFIYGLLDANPVPTEPSGPPGCDCAEKTRQANYKTYYDCPHCRS